MKVLRTALALLVLSSPLAYASGLRGSRASMVKQHNIAVHQYYTFLRTAKQVRAFAALERLDTVVSNSDYVISDAVSFPYARPIVKLFLERIAAQYHTAMGERLVVTSLTRPLNRQPRNASPLSVHPTGMAIDFRIPSSAVKRSWLEQALLSLEDRGVLDVTRERHPKHYHVAVFPEQYGTYIEHRITNDSSELLDAAATPASLERAEPVVMEASVLPSADAPFAGLRMLLVSVAGYLLAVGAAAFGTLRATKRYEALARARSR